MTFPPTARYCRCCCLKDNWNTFYFLHSSNNQQQQNLSSWKWCQAARQLSFFPPWGILCLGLWGTSLNADGFIILQLSIYFIMTCQIKELANRQVLKISVAETQTLAFPSFILLRTWRLHFPWCNSANSLVRDLVQSLYLLHLALP